MELLGGIMAVALLSVSIGLMIKKSNPEIALAVSICACIVILAMLVPTIVNIKEYLATFVPEGYEEIVYLPLLKVAGIVILARLVAELCRDAGEGALAFKVELAGTAAALAAALPLFGLLFDLLKEMTGG